MTGPRFASFTAPSSYWQASRAPRYSLLFALLVALGVGIAVSGVTSGVRGLVQARALAPPVGLDRWTRLMVSLGAGIYEELLFRVLLVAGLAAAARTLLGWSPVAAACAATLL